MAKQVKPGDMVVFHARGAHTCADTAHCRCKCDLKVPARVVSVYDEDPDLVVLDVLFPRNMIVDKSHAITDARGEPVVTTLTSHGFTGRQAHVPRATTSPAPSGTWTAT